MVTGRVPVKVRSCRSTCALPAVIIIERIFELVVPQRHARASLAEGGIEYRQGHFPVMVASHVGSAASSSRP